MGKAIKWIGIGLGSIVVVFGLVVAYVAATFNPNDYKADIVKAVKDKTGRTLQLKGDIGLSIFPTLGAKVGQSSLSERKSDREFASFEQAVVAVKLMPLLSKEVIVDAIELKGLRANVTRDKSGKFNFDDLMQADEKKKDEPKTASPVKIDIDHIEISDADVTFVDQAGGTQYRLSKLNVKTGRVASGVTTPLDLSATVASGKDKSQIDTKVKGKLTFDLERQLYKLADLDFSAKGNYAGISGMNATAKGNVEARLATGEYVANGLVVSITGKQTGGDLNLKLDAPRLILTKDKVDGSKVAIDAQLNEAKSKLNAKITLASVQGAFNAFKAGPLEADIEMQGDGRTIKAKLAGTLNGNLEAKRFELPNLALNAKVSDPHHPKGAFDASITGSARADLTKDTAGLDFTGKLDESNVNGKVGITDFSPLAVTFNVNADQLDVDRLLGHKPPGKDAKSEPAKTASAKDDKIDLSALKGLNAAGSVKIGKLTAMNMKSSQVSADLKVANGRLDVAPISAQLYQGTLNGSLSAHAADNAVLAIKQTLSGVSVGPLLRDAANIDTLEGKGTVNVDLTARGATLDALKKALNGTAAVNLADGSIKGIDIAGTIRNARAKVQQLRGQQVQASDKTQKTDFSELKATFNVKDGVAHNNDLSLKSPLLRVGGEGDIDIGHDKLNYVLKATLVASAKGQGGKDATDLSGITVPVKLTGALDAPQWSIDFAGMVTDVAKQRLQDEILKRIPGLPGQAPAAKAGEGKAADGKAPPAKAADGKAADSGSPKDAITDRLKGIFGR